MGGWYDEIVYAFCFPEQAVKGAPWVLGKEVFLPEDRAPVAVRAAAGLNSERKGLTPQDCYQCQKCSAGCPVAFAMDYRPNQVMQMISLGMKERLLVSRTIWVCASCYTCSTRCPNDIDIAGVMDALRQEATRQGVPPAEKEVALFHRTFLESIRRHGRIHELGLMARYKIKTGKMLEDFKLGWKMFGKGKLRLLPSGVKKKKEISGIFHGSKNP